MKKKYLVGLFIMSIPVVVIEPNAFDSNSQPAILAL